MAEEHDLIVIGMGVGGEEVAGRCAEAGMDVLAIEKKLVGGECPYWGCIPSKVMVRAGTTLAEAARATGLAGNATISPEWAPVAKRVREVTADWNDEIAVERHEKKGSTVVRGTARLVSRNEVEVDGERYRARRGIVLAAGSEPAMPPIEGLDSVDFWTNREAIEATEVPGSLAVVGTGPVGLELGQVYRRFGSSVTLVELADHVLPPEEPENGDALGAAMSAEGMDVRVKVTAERVERAGDGIRLHLSDGASIDADRVLVATGRRTTLDELGVGAVGLDEDAPAVAVDERLSTGDGLWAVGDITGIGPFTHLAVYQGRVAAADILGHDHRPADYRAVPRVTFTDPEVASVGLTEAKAREQGLDVRTGIAQTKSSARGWIHGPGAEHGVAKLIADAKEKVLVGGSVMGPAAGDVLGFLVLAIKERIPLAALRDVIYPYPTFVRGLEDALREVDA